MANPLDHSTRRITVAPPEPSKTDPAANRGGSRGISQFGSDRRPHTSGVDPVHNFPGLSTRTAITETVCGITVPARTTKFAPSGRAPGRHFGIAKFGGFKNAGSPSGAPPSTHSAIRTISSWLNEKSFVNSPNPFAAGQGGICRTKTASLIATAHGFTAEKLPKAIGAMPPA